MKVIDNSSFFSIKWGTSFTQISKKNIIDNERQSYYTIKIQQYYIKDQIPIVLRNKKCSTGMRLIFHPKWTRYRAKTLVF
jgi:hypothetical protein